MVLRRFRRKRDADSRRYAYSRWDGTQSGFDLNAFDLFAELTDELIHHGDPNSALRNLLQQGFDANDQHIQGLREILEKLAQERRERLENHDLGGVYDEIAQELRELIADERDALDELAEQARQSGDERRAEITNNTVTEKNIQLDLLPSDLAGQVKGLENYDFQSAEAQQRFDDLMNRLREQLMQSQLDQMAQGVGDMSPEDMARMKDMFAELNQMLEQRMNGEEPDFDGFMERFGDFFPENPETLDELLEVMAQRMAAMQAMMNSMTPEQRAQMQALSDQLLEDMDLRWQAEQLSQNLRQMFPNAGWQQSYDFSGFDPLDMGSAMDMMGDLNDLDQLENLLRGTTNPGALAEVDLERARQLLGDDAANSLEQLSRLSKMLEDSGLVENNDGKLELTPRAIRRIANQALSDLFSSLSKNTVGRHELAQTGSGHEREYTTKPYEWGDPFNLHIEKTIRNAITRTGGGTPVSLTPDDFEVERTEHIVQSSTVLMLDMSLSMPMRDNFLPAKKVAMALYGLISSQYPRDYLGVVGFSDIAKKIEPTKLPSVQWDFVYGTNMQHGFMLARDMLSKQSGNKQIIMITDGEPTAHLDSMGRPHFNYPPIQETIDKTLIEVNRCTREDIRINVFMLDATPYLTRFIEKITQLNGGRAFFTTPQNLGDYVLVDFVEHKRAMRTGRR
jgi:uncharacterized protein with von Willebrand factor type A (vWA) domain